MNSSAIADFHQGLSFQSFEEAVIDANISGVVLNQLNITKAEKYYIASTATATTATMVIPINN